MLNFIRIENFALIASAELEFAPSFNVITGESGAGKSILIGAVDLLTGGRADRGGIGSFGDRITVAGSFTVPDALAQVIGSLCAEAGVPFDKELFFRRVIGENMSKNYLNDVPVSVKFLKSIAGELIDMHGANEQLSLLSPERQLLLFDRYAGALDLRLECARICREIAGLDKRKREFAAAIPDAAEADKLELLVEDITKVNPQPNEDESLNAKHKLAANAQQIIAISDELQTLFTGDQNSVLELTIHAYRKLNELARLEESVAAGLLADCSLLQESVRNLSDNISELADNIELDPGELVNLEQRLSAIYTLKRRYGPSLDQVFAALARAEDKLKVYRESQSQLAQFDRQKAELVKDLAAVSARLSQQRRGKAEQFCAAVGEKLKLLGFLHSKLECCFEPVEPGPEGMEKLELLLSSNREGAASPLRRIASSGELSRLMLAMKTVLADADHIPVVIFDEIDVNIGGETANFVGEELKRLGQNRQILCISHLAQVASRGDRHICVGKSEQNGKVISQSQILSGDDRTLEIARMLGGGASALAHAGDILAKKL